VTPEPKQWCGESRGEQVALTRRGIWVPRRREAVFLRQGPAGEEQPSAPLGAGA
jgi:hypothetical protein